MAHPFRIDGAALRHLRKTRGHRSAATLAPLLGLSAPQLRAIERNVANVSAETYTNLLSHFGLPNGSLLASPGTCPHCGAARKDPVPDAA